MKSCGEGWAPQQPTRLPAFLVCRALFLAWLHEPASDPPQVGYDPAKRGRCREQQRRNIGGG
jgi:hypothetical protein